MLKVLGVLVVAAVAVAASVLAVGNIPDPLPSNLLSAQMLHSGPYDVDAFDIKLVDETRPTRPNGDYKGADSRTLKTTVWYPDELIDESGGPAVSPRPLLIYSHGFSSERHGGEYLARHFASHGYIVAAMDYPLTNMFAPGDPMLRDVVNQPADISFLIDQFLSWSQEQGNQFHQAVDPKRIGALGLSLGGMTTTLAAYHPRMADPRISAAVSIAGPSFMFGAAFFEHRQLPFMMVASPIDALVGYGANAVPIKEKLPSSVLVTIDGGSHTGFADAARYMRWMDNPDALGCYIVMKNLEDEPEEPWYNTIGTPAEGVLEVEALPPMCMYDPLPLAMNPLRQHQFNTLAVYSFFQSQFAESPTDRARFHSFLHDVLPREIPEVRVE